MTEPMSTTFRVGTDALTLSQLRTALGGPVRAELTPAAMTAVQAGADAIGRIVLSGAVV